MPIMRKPRSLLQGDAGAIDNDICELYCMIALMIQLRSADEGSTIFYTVCVDSLILLDDQC